MQHNLINRRKLSPRQLVCRMMQDWQREMRPFDQVSDAALVQQDGPEAAFALRLADCIFRHYGQIEEILKKRLKQPRRLVGSGALDILYLAVAEWLFLGTPAHAAFAEANKLASQSHAAGFKPLINGVLRQLQRDFDAGLLAIPSPQHNFSKFFKEKYTAHYGKAAFDSLAHQLMQPVPLDITVKADVNEWATKLGATVMPTNILRVQQRQGAISSWQGYAEGDWWVQDLAASLAVKLSRNIKKGIKAYDLCAAPGGKTAQLIAYGADVTALDVSASRITRMKQNLARLGYEAKIIKQDALKFNGAALPLVLLDAPCSASGTCRRNPDMLRSTEKENIHNFLVLQAALLDKAAALTAIGGELIYAVCSIWPEEGEDQLRQFLARHSDFTLSAILPAELPGLDITAFQHGYLRLLPHMHGGEGGVDGFFIARLLRQG